MIDLPAAKVGAVDFPLFALAVRCQHERAFPCSYQNPYSAHLLVLWIPRSALAIDHPRHAELIGEHTKAGGPEGLLDRHMHLPVLCQDLEDAFRLSRAVDVERHGEACRFLVVFSPSIRTHQRLIAYN